MDNQSLIKEFKTALKKNGHSFRFFIDQYLPDIGIKYAAIHHQMRGYSSLSDEVQSAMQKYISED